MKDEGGRDAGRETRDGKVRFRAIARDQSILERPLAPGGKLHPKYLITLPTVAAED